MRRIIKHANNRHNKKPPIRLRISMRRIVCLLSTLVTASSIVFLFAVYTLHHNTQVVEKDDERSSIGSSRNRLSQLQQQQQQPPPYEFSRKKKSSSVLQTKKKIIPSPTNKRHHPQKGSVQEYLLQIMNRTFLPLMAYVEPSPLSINNATLPLPRRYLHNPQLKQYTYSNNIQSCRDLPNNWPVHHSEEFDFKFGPNVGQLHSLHSVRDDYAKLVCPVDADPFLPWIHDVFPSMDGRYVEFVAHNKRRCRTAYSFMDDLRNLEPQVALLQSIPVKRILTREERQKLGLDNGRSNSSAADTNNEDKPTMIHRYRLASLEEADEDGRETRFICQFHTLRPNDDADGNAGTTTTSFRKVVLGETLSVYPYNYEHANFRKGPKPHPMLTRPTNAKDIHGAHNEQVWNSILHFRCPVPQHLQETVQSGESVLEDDIPTLYLDLVPIRTRPRETLEGYCPQVPSNFDPHQEWGDAHVLPPVEESGRWANIPICRPPLSSLAKQPKDDYVADPDQAGDKIEPEPPPSKSHYLVGCLWASAAFTTRGVGATLDTSTSLRLLEWLAYHLFIAKFDHIYIYDNTEAHTNATSLQPVLDLFSSDRVTRIPWKHRVCNNNRPAHKNAGERSSQYAAEASCRIRYGPTTEWLISFDTDEYLIPQGNWSDLKEWLQESVKSGKIGKDTHILSFFQTRALPNIQYMEPFSDEAQQCGATMEEARCLSKRQDTSFLRSYDCERTPLPKPDFGWRAKKQIYRPSFVLNHFVHYSTVTRRIHEAPAELSPPFQQRRPWERRVDELTEAFMLHTKTTPPIATRDWSRLCRSPDGSKNCPVGVAWPLNEAPKSNVTDDGLAYNCHQHQRIQEGLASKLETILEPLLKRYYNQ